ncbi:c6 transcription factor [Pyrenophora seminiperda CCB06]|uniref:C6 transcription factor n=1 Tax=Pyrenophora seminiperda CCB06 TaxID=1302712 RepID=A0A3M7M320_9PLEO|nr:c6 transcription factor [Pyrenophora seminiperda CCB06]
MEPQQCSSASTGEGAAARPNLRPLLPASSFRNEAPFPHSKRVRVNLACAPCRSRKTKCNGDRPTCSECAARDSRCIYTETETTQTKRKHQDLEELFELLKSLPDKEASEVLGRIRAGMEPRHIIETVSHGNMLMHFASSVGSNRLSVSSSQGGEWERRRSESGENEKPQTDEDTSTMESSEEARSKTNTL